MKHCILIIVALLSFVSCQDIDVTHVAGRYYLVVTDVKEDRKLSYSPAEGSYAGGVPPMVYAIWHNDDFIIAKQHPSRGSSYPKLHKTLYYIIPLKNPVSEFPDENFIGPLDEKEYAKKIKELKITDKITFEEIK
jgi:hypothetical protein